MTHKEANAAANVGTYLHHCLTTPLPDYTTYKTPVLAGDSDSTTILLTSPPTHSTHSTHNTAHTAHTAHTHTHTHTLTHTAHTAHTAHTHSHTLTHTRLYKLTRGIRNWFTQPHTTHGTLKLVNPVSNLILRFS